MKDGGDFLPCVAFFVHRGRDEPGQFSVKTNDRFGPLGTVGGYPFKGCHAVKSSSNPCVYMVKRD